jgi:hypothetical protein
MGAFVKEEELLEEELEEVLEEALEEFGTVPRGATVGSVEIKGDDSVTV